MKNKQAVLQTLEQHRGTYCSGEALAQALGVSRAAVWKAIEQLRGDGHQIEAAPRRGYRLSCDSDLLTAEGIRAALPIDWQTLPITVYQQVDSTNLAARRASAASSEGGRAAATPSVFLAEEQTAGRGRMGRSFFSPAHRGIYMSLLLRPELVPSDAVLLTTAASVAVCRALEETLSLQAQIKWVNDIYLEGKKVCGILTEAVTDMESGQISSIILGIGVNVWGCMEEFPPALQETARALFVQSGVQRNQLAACIIRHLLTLWEDLQLGSRAYLEEYKERSLLLNKPIWVIEGNRRTQAVARGVDSRGGLIVEEDGSMRTLSSGEVSIRLI